VYEENEERRDDNAADAVDAGCVHPRIRG